MKKVLSLLLMVLLTLSFSSCGAENVGRGDVPGATLGEDGLGRVEAESADVSSMDSTLGTSYAPSESPEYSASMDGSLGTSSAPSESPEGEPGTSAEVKPAAGTLTCGEWSDLKNLDFWKNLLRENDWFQLMEQRNLYTDEVAVVSVKDKQQNPCYNAKVELVSAENAVLYTGKTDVYGMAYLPYDLSNVGKVPATVLVNGDVKVDFSAEITEVVLDSGRSDVTELDVMFTVDTTGSMADELRYLQAELENVIRKVSVSSQNTLSIQMALVFYRDKGDVYEVETVAFSDHLDSVIITLNKQSANGGGDYPEAVHTALEKSLYGPQWRENAVKLMFLVLDAPPHSEKEISGIDKKLKTDVSYAASQGIRIIPIASSGVDRETEFLLRSYAVMTGGTYIFLTDHSGVGNSHLEPTVGEYQVEALNSCLIRIIKEYCKIAS